MEGFTSISVSKLNPFKEVKDLKTNSYIIITHNGYVIVEDSTVCYYKFASWVYNNNTFTFQMSTK